MWWRLFAMLGVVGNPEMHRYVPSAHCQVMVHVDSKRLKAVHSLAVHIYALHLLAHISDC